MALFREKKSNPRRDQVRKSISAGRTGGKFTNIARLDVFISLAMLTAFVLAASAMLSFELIAQGQYLNTIPIIMIVSLLTTAMAVYIFEYQKRIVKNHTRMLSLIVMYLILIGSAKLGYTITGRTSFATGTAITAALILSIAYHERFAIGMSLFYAVFACLAVNLMSLELFLTMTAGTLACCFSLKEISTRMKLLEVGAIAAAVVFIMYTTVQFWNRQSPPGTILYNAGLHAGSAILIALVIQALLPLIEKAFGIATSMTLLDYSDANQPLLKKLAMEAPGTYSHSLLVGTISEKAADAINRNGLLCRVGSYYHDIGKISKAGYFIENEMGQSKHKELSPAMSQLIIVGHVKDGVEMAREYNLPAVLRQFVETHHGTTLVEYFYNQAKKKEDEKTGTTSESEFRYTGPKPRTKEAAIVMLADAVEGAVRSLGEVNSTKIENVVHNMAMKRLQDGQFDECDLSLRELSRIEAAISKSLAAYYHGRIAYPTRPDLPEMINSSASKSNGEKGTEKQNGNQ